MAGGTRAGFRHRDRPDRRPVHPQAGRHRTVDRRGIRRRRRVAHRRKRRGSNYPGAARRSADRLRHDLRGRGERATAVAAHAQELAPAPDAPPGNGGGVAPGRRTGRGGVREQGRLEDQDQQSPAARRGGASVLPAGTGAERDGSAFRPVFRHRGAQPCRGGRGRVAASPVRPHPSVPGRQRPRVQAAHGLRLRQAGVAAAVDRGQRQGRLHRCPGGRRQRGPAAFQRLSGGTGGADPGPRHIERTARLRGQALAALRKRRAQGRRQVLPAGEA